jgi:2-keto-3-deoxy-L-fuconate dehydrogenase
MDAGHSTFAAMRRKQGAINAGDGGSMGRLTGKVAIVTAAANGIGKATALAFAREGARVIATDIDSVALAELDTCETRRVDVTRVEDFRDLAADIPEATILFNAAGIVNHGTVLDCTDMEWERAFAINVTGMFRAIQAFLPGMLTSGGGSIINIASVASSLKGLPNRCAYGASKAAVIGLTKSVAADFVTRNIRCNAICPGTVETPSLRARIAEQAKKGSKSEAEIRLDFIARQPLGRLGTPEEIAALAVYLASDESAFTTGTVQIVDGGLTN